MPSTAVVGIGNTLMGDDGVGAVIVRRLAERRLAEDTVVAERPNADAALMKYFLRYDRVFVVDALDAGADPGSVFRFDPDVTGVTALRSNNIHGMGVGFLLTNARLCGASPAVTIFGVQVEDVRPRPDVLSASVEQAIDSVVEMLERELGDPVAASVTPEA